MKKRVLMLALVMSLVLAFGAVAQADGDVWFNVTNVSVNNSLSGVKNGEEVTVSFTFDFKAYNAAAGENEDTRYKNANLVTWTIGDTDSFEAKSGGSKVSVKANNAYGTASEGDCYLWVITDTEGSTLSLSVDVVGTIKDVSESLPIKLTLYAGNDEATAMASDNNITGPAAATFASVTTKANTGNEVDTGDDTTIPVNDDGDDTDSDILDPTYPNGGDNPISGDYGTAKPKLGKITASDFSFTGGTPKSNVEIPMVGPITKVNVYIAGKDAVKLFNYGEDPWTDKTKNMELNTENIEKYSIPFYISSYDFSPTVTVENPPSDAAKLKKAEQKAWKSAENKLLLNFTGANVALKNFPITIAMSNANTAKNGTDKPVAKAIKVNVTPKSGSTADKFSWTYTEYEDSEKAYSTLSGQTLEGDGETTLAKLASDALKAVSPNYDYDSCSVSKISSGDVADVTETTVLAEGVSVSADIRAFVYEGGGETTVTIGKKGVEYAVGIYPAIGEAEQFEKTYTVGSVDVGPYYITVKPDPSKDKAKIDKMLSKDWEINIVQPIYDEDGNLSEQGYVSIYGYPTNTTKETKLALTLTATNPSTKKKGAAKVTLIGKLAPNFDTKKTTYLADDEGNADENGEYKYLSNPKKVEAGKVPSVKFKATGSKTIGYKLGDWYVEGGKVYDNREEYTAELVAALKAINLSFDEKKGAIVKTSSPSLPTLNEEGDAFESLDILVTAWNTVGTDQAYGQVLITGAKPTLVDKTVTIDGAVKTGTVKTFALKAGKTAVDNKTASTTANVKVYDGADSKGNNSSATTLAKYGLKLVRYDDEEESSTERTTAKVTSGDQMPSGWTAESKDLIASGEAVKSGDVYIASGDVTYYTSDATDGAAQPYLEHQNCGILVVTDPATLVEAASKDTDKIATKGVKINVTLENYGATNKGTFTLKLDKATTNSEAAATNASAPVVAGKVTKNGKGGGASTIAPESYELEAETEDKADETEAPLKTGAERTAADLTSAQNAYLAAKGYKVIAVLPELTANVDGQQDIDVELDEDAPEGEKMIYIPFPKDVPEVEDDSIVDFYDAAGAPIEEVPAEKAIVAAPWLRADVVYEPVIAVQE